jgi:signal transduction protein with GAF and PtsI domain
MDEEMIAFIRDRGIGVGETTIGRAAAQRTPIQIADTLKDKSLVLEIVVQAGFRSLLTVPLLRSDQIIGALVVRRKEPGKFPEHIVKLLQRLLISRSSQSKTHGYSARSRTRAASLKSQASTNRNSSPI